MKKDGIGLLAALSLIAAWGLAAPANVSGATLVVAPARYSVLQVGFDLVQRCGVTLVSYRGEATTEKPLIHVWTGQEWKFVSLPDFQSGAFLAQKPAQTLVIGNAQLVPAVFSPMAAWAGRVIPVTSLYSDEILNQAASALRFGKEDWDWFAARYNMKLNDTNAALRTDSWYDHTYDKPVRLQFKRRAPAKSPEVAPAQEAAPPAETNKTERPAAADEPVSGLSLRPTPEPVTTNTAADPAN